MMTARSLDGTEIAYETLGAGPPLVLIGGAFNDRRGKASGTPLAKLLAGHISVTSYDRRGRGDSANTPIAPGEVLDREVEDLAAVITALGGRASLFGMSSGGLLAVAATTRSHTLGIAIDRLATYEAPVVTNDAARPSLDLADEMRTLVSSGDRGEAAALFLTRVVGVPAPVVANMRHAPMWPGLEALAHTLPYDVEITASALTVVDAARGLTTPSLILAGDKGPPILADGTKLLAAALPHAELRILAGQTHDVDPAVLAAALVADRSRHATTSRS